MHRKDITVIILVVLVLALLADDSNSIRNSITDFSNSIKSKSDTPTFTGTSIKNEDIQSIDDIVKDAESFRKKGDTQYNLAQSAYTDVDWPECINRCISARNYYDNAKDEYATALEILKDSKEESANKVYQSFVDKSIEYYSCVADLGDQTAIICESMENACLEYSRGNDIKGNNYNDEIETQTQLLSDKETACTDLLGNLE